MTSKTAAPASAPAAVATVPAAAPSKRAVEEWAKLKKHTQAVARDGKRVEVPDFRFAAAKAHDGWAVGFELSEADYDDAVRRACGVALR